MTSTTVLPSINESLNESSGVPEYVEYQLSQFYNYLSDSLLEWNEMLNGRIDERWPVEKKDASKRSWKSFADYWTWSLYTFCGVKRHYHRYGPDITDEPEYNVKFFGKTRGLLVQLFYDKKLQSYDKKNPVTQLCRHLVFDMNSMSIVSLGVTKSLNMDAFEFYVGCDENDIENPVNKLPVVLEEFLEGTMVVYNPFLAKFKMPIINNKIEDGDEILHLVSDDKAPEKTWAISTRKVLGTSFFNNPGKTFQNMFEDNLVKDNINLALLPDEFKNNHIFVFNVEHEDNRIVAPEPVNRNTLVCVYKLGCTELMDGHLTTQLLGRLQNCSVHDGVLLEYDAYAIAFNNIADKQLSIVNLDVFVSQLRNYGVNFRVPAVLCKFSGPSIVNAECVKQLLAGQHEYSPGIMIKSPGGLRTKIRNENYTNLIALKGNTPISINLQNKKNLFKLYWKLVKMGDDSFTEFLKVFDTQEMVYANIFEWYKNCVNTLIHNLYIEYMTVFVRKERHVSTVVYEFKPLVCELHKLYLASRLPTTKDRVVEMVLGLEWYQVYWRLFGLE